ncbi:U-box domain-containing protein 19-like [Rutidosis leptorrhynchoides]|uniref:U-box domain-containing protein 19-like n=1 Tax=Rutidosis leptorrhynchoides TaxID=125765 RepID=UPI003A99126C
MYDANTRRILTFPAIRPCESVSPATLLTSLITLSETICSFKLKPLYTNAKNAKDSIRLVGNILVFLEEIRRDELVLSCEMVLSLSELHFVFQKLRFLLEDCTRSDARVLMLVRSQKVSNLFRAIFRSITVALDAMPLDSIDISYELKEVMGLINNQAFNSKLGFRPEDERVLEKFRSVLDQLEHQMNPDRKNLKRILDYLGIWGWVECNNEIKFLDSEIELERSNTKNSDLGILSTLMGFMVYSRCTLFTTVDSDAVTVSGDHGSDSCQHVITSLNVDDLRCPISLEIMLDPVTLTTGHTYDRSSIEKWFVSGNLTCPKTGEKVISGNIVSNLCIKNIIKEYCLENGISMAESGCSNRGRGNTHTSTGGSVAAEAAIRLAVDYLVDRLVFGTIDAKHKATYEVRLLSKTSIFNRACLVEAGVVPSLLDLICLKNPRIQENAIAALLNLSKYSKTKKVLVENGGLELILEVAQNGLKMEARQHAAGTLFYLTSVDEYRDIIGKIPRSIPVLMELVLEGTERCKKNALVAIFGLLKYPENHWKALAAGVVPLLVDLLRSSSQCEDILVDSLAILATLAEKPDGTMSIVSCGALHVILDVVGSTTSRASKEYCVALLLAMCKNGGADVVRVLVSNSSIMGPLYSLLTEGGSRASKKASSLIRILHDFNEKNASSATRRPVHFQEQFVDVW